VAGDYTELMGDSEEVFAYQRSCGTDKAVILSNWTEGEVSYDPSLVEGLDAVLDTHADGAVGTLKPLEAVVFASK
jgi:hypothetical protein